MKVRFGLRARIVVFLCSILALAWLANVLVVTPRVAASLRQEQENRVAQLAETVGREIEERVESAVRELEALARQDTIRSMDPERAVPVLALQDEVADLYLHHTLLDLDGTVVARPSKPRRVGADRSTRAYFTEALRSGETVITGPRISTAGNRALVAATPVLGADGEPVGVLTGALGLMDRNRALYNPILRARTEDWPVELFLMGTDGNVLASSTVLGSSTKRGVSLAPPLENPPGEQGIVDAHGREWVVSVHRLEPLGWTVAARVPASFIAERAAAVTHNYNLAALVISLIALVVALLASGLVTRPLARLSAALTAYGRDLPTEPVPDDGPPEVVRVARAFNRMRDERRDLELQLRHSQKLQTLGTFAGGIAHDFNNLLVPIVLGTSALAPHHRDDPKMRQLVADMELSANRARDLLSRLLAFSRLNKPERIPVDLGDAAADALRLASFQVPKNVEIVSDLEPGLVVLGDPLQLQQAILNLLTNGLDAMRSRGGRLELRLIESPCGGTITLEVRDTGEGIDPAVIDRVFEPFYTTKASDRGTGLGLSIVKGIIDDHGGTVRVESTAGRGTTFHIELPRHRATGEVPAVSETAKREPARILVVDDDPWVARALHATLEELGHEVAFETDPRQALSRIVDDGESFDLIITDNQMPELTGVDLAARLLDHRPTQRIVMLTGAPSEALERRCLELAIGKPLAKPLTATALEQSVTDALRDPLPAGAAHGR